MSQQARRIRHARVRRRVWGTKARPRLCPFRSLNHIYAQVVDDDTAHTLVSASSLDVSFQGKTKTEKAGLVGALVAERALERGIGQVVFDRGGYKYHGRVKRLAEAAREAGLKF